MKLIWSFVKYHKK